jgi:hypothetical protein
MLKIIKQHGPSYSDFLHLHHFLLPVFQIWIQIHIRIHRIHMFLGPPDPDPDSLVRCMDPDPSKNSKKNLDSYCFVTSFGLFIFEK